MQVTFACPSAAKRSTQLFFRMKDASKPLLAAFLGTL
jgi:hypothetical protein